VLLLCPDMHDDELDQPSSSSFLCCFWQWAPAGSSVCTCRTCWPHLQSHSAGSFLFSLLCSVWNFALQFRYTNCKNKNLFMLLQVLKHLIFFFADDVLEAEGNFHQPFHMILMIMGNGRVTFQAEAAMPSAQNLVLLSQVRTPRHDNLYITVVNGKRCWFFCFIPGRTSFSVHPYA